MADPREVAGSAPDHPGTPGRGDAPDYRTVLLVIVAVVVGGWALRATAAVAIPLVASVLIALALMPVRDSVRRVLPQRIGWLGVLAAMGLLLLVIGLFFGALWLAAQQVAGEFPARPGQSLELAPPGVPPVNEGAADATAESAGNGTPSQMAGGDGSGNLREAAGEIAARFGDTILGLLAGTAKTVLASAVAIVSALVMIFFLTLLILIESDDWGEKLTTITTGTNARRLTEAAAVIARKLRVYLLVRTVLGIITAILYGLWLWFFGVGLILVWMILTFVLSFIPTIGSIIAGVLPVIYAFVTLDVQTALTVGVGILVIEQVMGNFVDPRIEGSRTAVSPLVVLVALLLWSWLWGIAGALLAVPLTMSLVVIGAHVPPLRSVALLLSDRTDMPGLREATSPDRSAS